MWLGPQSNQLSSIRWIQSGILTRPETRCSSNWKLLPLRKSEFLATRERRLKENDGSVASAVVCFEILSLVDKCGVDPTFSFSIIMVNHYSLVIAGNIYFCWSLLVINLTIIVGYCQLTYWSPETDLPSPTEGLCRFVSFQVRVRTQIIYQTSSTHQSPEASEFFGAANSQSASEFSHRWGPSARFTKKWTVWHWLMSLTTGAYW